MRGKKCIDRGGDWVGFSAQWRYIRAGKPRRTRHGVNGAGISEKFCSLL